MNDAGAVIDRAAYAGFWRRFAAYAIDYAVLFLASALLGVVATELDRAARTVRRSCRRSCWPATCSIARCSRARAGRRTLGKLALGIEVTSLRGERIGFGARGRALRCRGSVCAHAVPRLSADRRHATPPGATRPRSPARSSHDATPRSPRLARSRRLGGRTRAAAGGAHGRRIARLSRLCDPRASLRRFESRARLSHRSRNAMAQLPARVCRAHVGFPSAPGCRAVGSTSIRSKSCRA